MFVKLKWRWLFRRYVGQYWNEVVLQSGKVLWPVSQYPFLNNHGECCLRYFSVAVKEWSGFQPNLVQPRGGGRLCPIHYSLPTQIWKHNDISEPTFIQLLAERSGFHLWPWCYVGNNEMFMFPITTLLCTFAVAILGGPPL